MTELLRWLPYIAALGIVGVVCGWLGWLLRDEQQYERELAARLREAANRELGRRERAEWLEAQAQFESESG